MTQHDTHDWRKVAFLGGGGLLATVLGFGLGGISHPLTVAGGGFGIVGTIGFYALLGFRRARGTRIVRVRRTAGDVPHRVEGDPRREHK